MRNEYEVIKEINELTKKIGELQEIVRYNSLGEKNMRIWEYIDISKKMKLYYGQLLVLEWVNGREWPGTPKSKVCKYCRLEDMKLVTSCPRCGVSICDRCFKDGKCCR